MRLRSYAGVVVPALAVAVGAGCTSALTGSSSVDTTPGGGGAVGPATYAGAMADSLKIGALTLTISSTASVSGTLTFVGGPTVAIAGSYEGSTAYLTANGGGYSLSGTPSNGTIAGKYSGPGGLGYYVVVADALTRVTHRTYCGQYQSTTGNGFIGAVIDGVGGVTGFAVQTAGNASSATFTGNLVGILLTAVTSQATSLTGKTSPDLTTITGSYAPLAGTTAGTGTFSVSTGGC